MPAAIPTPLTVTQAIERLTRIAERHGDSALVVGFDAGKSTLGPRPATPITAIQTGFDWDSGKVFLQTQQQLGVAGEELALLKKQYHRATQALGWLLMTLQDKRMSDADKVQAALATLATYRQLPATDLLTQVQSGHARA